MRAQTKRDVKRLRSEVRETKQRPARTWFKSVTRVLNQTAIVMRRYLLR